MLVRLHQVVHGYKCLKRTQWQLLQYWSTKTKSYKLMDTSQYETKVPILVTPLVFFCKNSFLYDELRTILGQLLVLMKNRLMCTSAQTCLRHIDVFSKQSRKYKRATLGGEATPVCSDSLWYILGQTGGI